MIASVLRDNLNTTNDTPLAKPNLKLVQAFGKGILDISGSTMDFLMYLSPYIDHDGKIIIPLDQARFALSMQTNTYARVLREAKYHQFIIQKGNHYYSQFHIITNGSSSEFSYLKLINVYSSATLHAYSLRYKRLFYYFASSTRMGDWGKIHIENLYRNKIHKEGTGVNYFETFHEISEALLTLIRDGLIEIKLYKNQLENTHAQILTVDTPFLEERFYSFFDFSKGQKKKRTSLRQSIERVIQVRISRKIVNDELKLSASKTEFIQIADENQIAWKEMSSVNINYIIGYKNDLIRVAGLTGLAIYRKSLQAFLKDNAYSFLHFDRENKVANYFMDFYVLKEIRNILTGAAYHQKWMPCNISSAWKADWKVVVCNDYQVDYKTIGELLAFYTERGSMNHKVLLDGDLMKMKIDYYQLTFNESEWLHLKQIVETEYELRRLDFQKADTILRPIHVYPKEWRNFMINCAENGLFVKKEEFEQLLKQKRKRIKTIIASPVKPVPFYNWLIERD